MKQFIFRIHNKARALLALPLLLLLITSCVREQQVYPAPDGDETLVRLSLKVPSASGTRGLSGAQEDAVKNIQVLAFGTDNKFAYSATSSETSDGRTFEIMLRRGTWNLVVLANAQDAIGGISVGEAQAIVLNRLTRSINAGTGWSTAGLIADGIPMSSDVRTEEMIDDATSTITDVELYRMVARVNVAVATAAQDDFELTSVRVYNYERTGKIYPTISNDKPIIALPTSGSDKIRGTADSEKLVYAATTAATSENEIYLNPSAAGSGSSLSTNTCLVVGGKYNGDATPTYYRVDFSDNTGTYLDLIRNHKYLINIKSVGGPGYGSENDAFDSHPVNIECDVIEWHEGGMGDIRFDGQNYLAVAPTEFEFFRNESTGNSFMIKTDVTTGWTVTGVTDSPNAGGATQTWIKNISGSFTAVDIKDQVRFNVEENNTPTERTAYIHIRAGRLDFPIMVTQSAVEPIEITAKVNGVEVSEIVFSNAAGDISPKTLNVSWLPKDAALEVTTSPVGTTPPFAGTNCPTSGTINDVNGTKSYSISTPNNIASEIATNPFYEQISKVDFLTRNPAGERVAKSVFVRYVNYGLKVEEMKSSYMLSSATTYSFTVKSNCNWEIVSVTGDTQLLGLQTSDNMKSGTTGGNNTTTISFTTINSSNQNGTVTVKFGSTDSPKKFADYDVELKLMSEYYPPLHSGWAGSNIYWDGSKLTFADVGAAAADQQKQGVYFQWGSLWGISPMGAWSGSSTILYPPDGGTSTASASGYGTWNTAPYVANTVNITCTPPGGNSPSNSSEPYSARDRAYLYEITDGGTGLGDICKWLTEQAPGGKIHGKTWRMPTSQEFEAASGAYTKTPSTGGFTSIASNDATGTQLYTSGYNKAGAGTPYFPAAGYRNYSGGALYYVGQYGYYWSGSPNGTDGYYLYFNSGDLYPSNNSYRSYGFSVRCVAE